MNETQDMTEGEKQFLSDIKALAWVELKELRQLNVKESSYERYQGHISSLRLYGLNSLTAIPSSIKQLKWLECLDIISCDSFNEFPREISGLRWLGSIYINNCPSFKTFPEFMMEIKNLSDILITQCQEFHELPTNLNDLKHLRFLSVNGCPKFNKYPDSIIDCHNLEQMFVDNLDELPPAILPFIRQGEQHEIYITHVHFRKKPDSYNYSMSNLGDSIKELYFLNYEDAVKEIEKLSEEEVDLLNNVFLSEYPSKKLPAKIKLWWNHATIDISNIFEIINWKLAQFNLSSIDQIKLILISSRSEANFCFSIRNLFFISTTLLCPKTPREREFLLLYRLFYLIVEMKHFEINDLCQELGFHRAEGIDLEDYWNEFIEGGEISYKSKYLLENHPYYFKPSEDLFYIILEYQITEKGYSHYSTKFESYLIDVDLDNGHIIPHSDICYDIKSCFNNWRDFPEPSWYFDRINANTCLITHPFEILADNFALLVMGLDDYVKNPKIPKMIKAKISTQEA